MVSADNQPTIPINRSEINDVKFVNKNILDSLAIGSVAEFQCRGLGCPVSSGRQL
jgi:hypothetical protein